MTVILDRPVPTAATADTAGTAPGTGAATGHTHRPITHPQAPGLDIVGNGALVPLITGDDVEYANLDHAASAPALRRVQQVVDSVLDRYASVHRGAGWHSQLCTEWYEGAREPVREFVGGRRDDAVIFTRHTTDAFNLLAHCLPARITVVVFETEHHAALLPWTGRNVIRLPAPESPAAAVAAVCLALRRRPPGPALLVVTGASNVTGEVWPVAELAAAARAHGARIALDAAQLAPHRAFSITDLGVDYVAISGHKLYAPYGAGALVGRPDWLASAPPYLIGGGATESVTADATVYRPLPDRHEAGTPNVTGAVALATACHLLATADRAALAATEATLTNRLRSGLAEIPGVTVHSLFGGAVDTIGVVAFTVAGRSAALVAAALSAEHGIGVRDGAFCAHPLVRKLLGTACCDSPDDGTTGDPRDGAGDINTGKVNTDAGTADGSYPDTGGQAVRASVGLGSTSEHVDRIVAAVRSISGRGPRRRYILVDDRPVPADDRRERPVIAPWQVNREAPGRDAVTTP